MRYVSTRSLTPPVQAATAIVRGLAPDGGLYVPCEFPKKDLAFIRSLVPLDYPERVARVLADWLTDFSPAELSELCRASCQRVSAPVHRLLNDTYVLELYHGPTCAFKDMALQMLPRLLTASAKKIGETREICILVATSGDTGKAALEGFRDVPGTRIAVFYPDGGVSEMQKLQMVTQEGGNTRVIAVRGNFDDAQSGVKRIFASPEAAQALDKRGVILSSANSINLGRLLPQIAYYFSAYADMAARGAMEWGARINVCVPTGNFGNILAAVYAREMGLPIGRLICASNDNHVLYDFIKTGLYDRNRPLARTTSPSMDILLSSNLERILYQIAGRDCETVAGWMRSLRETGRYRLTSAALEKLRLLLYGGWADESLVAGMIRHCWADLNYLVDPHTAVGLCVERQYTGATGDAAPCLVVATASPYKFPHTVCQAVLGAAPQDEFACLEALKRTTGREAPAALEALRGAKVRHTEICDPAEMQSILLGGF